MPVNEQSKLAVELPSDTEIVMRCTFDAPSGLRRVHRARTSSPAIGSAAELKSPHPSATVEARGGTS